MPIQWPGKITLPMSGAADPDDFAKRWEETFKGASAITDPSNPDAFLSGPTCEECGCILFDKKFCTRSVCPRSVAIVCSHCGVPWGQGCECIDGKGVPSAEPGHG